MRSINVIQSMTPNPACPPPTESSPCMTFALALSSMIRPSLNLFLAGFAGCGTGIDCGDPARRARCRIRRRTVDAIVDVHAAAGRPTGRTFITSAELHGSPCLGQGIEPVDISTNREIVHGCGGI